MSVGTVSTFKCPACGKVGSSSRVIPPGTRVRCKCGHAFRTEDRSDSYEVSSDPVIDVPETQASDNSFDPGDLANIETIAESPIIKKALKADDLPIVVQSSRRGSRGPEPRYFRIMEIFGWISVDLGLVAFVATIGTCFVLTLIGLFYAPDEASAWQILMGSAILFLAPVAWATGVMVVFLLNGFGLWIIVDIARSLRFQCWASSTH